MTFSESVTGVTTGAFQVTATGSASGTHRLPVSASSGTIVLDDDGQWSIGGWNVGGWISATAGPESRMWRAIRINGGFATGQLYTIDNTMPVC